jgi:putative CocE/NonD family hydrolase
VSNNDTPISIEKGIMVPMRDGVRLATDIYRPAQDHALPVLLTRLPYSKEKEGFLWIPPERACRAGYAVVVQDTRGRYASEGEFPRPFDQDDVDGADTIAWIAQQPWCNGAVGMFGLSGQGITQWLAATEPPPALQAIAPMFCPATIDRVQYQGGAFRLGTFLWWAIGSGATGEVERRLMQGRGSQAELDMLVQAEAEIEPVFKRLPLTDMPLLQPYTPYYFDWLTAPPTPVEASQAQAARCEQVSAPALHIGGWFDIFIAETLANYRTMRQQEKKGLARQQRLVIGPWAHIDFPGMFPDQHYGPTASTISADVVGMQLCWFDHWLKNKRKAGAQESRVLIFVMGANVWRDEDEWPLPDTHYLRYYLHSQGRANTATGDGELSPALPTDEPADTFCYDPHNPVPTVGGANLLLIHDAHGSIAGINAGPSDQRQVEQRDDVLCYTTQSLDLPLEVIGPVTLVLSISSSAPDTDLTGKLVDVYPDGRAEILTDGILRARYREPDSDPLLMKVGGIYELQIDIGATANVFKAGHRIRLEVSSSNFPRFDRNSNTGGVIATERADDFQPAINHVYHSSAHPSYLILPVIAR